MSLAKSNLVLDTHTLSVSVLILLGEGGEPVARWYKSVNTKIHKCILYVFSTRIQNHLDKKILTEHHKPIKAKPIFKLS